MTTFLMASVFSVSLICAADVTPEIEAWRKQALPEHVEFFDLIDSIYNQYDEHYAAAEKIQKPVEQLRFYEEKDPGHEYLPKLLVYEEQHRGSHLGLLALGRIVSIAAGRGSIDDVLSLGRRQALNRLHHYAADPLQIEVLRPLRYGAPDAEIITFLRQQIANPKAGPAVREFSKYFLAEYLIEYHGHRKYAEQRLDELKAGSKPLFAIEQQQLQREFSLYPSAEVVLQYEAEGLEILKSIVASNSQIREPAVKAISPHRFLLEIDNNPIQPGPLLTAKADGLLFRESHLKVGKPAPELALKLYSGKDWSLKDQRGRVTIIQFSSDNCVGCELMYPELRKLLAKHPEQVSVLTIMASEKPDECRKAVDSGKITWNLHWDGKRGPVATRWNIPAYPTTYIVDGNGRIGVAAVIPTELTAKVTKLLPKKPATN